MAAASGLIHFLNSVMVAAEMTVRNGGSVAIFPGSFLDVLQLSAPGFTPFIARMADRGECA